MSAPPARGELGEHPLPQLLLELHTARFEGQLVLERETVTKTVQLHRGVPVQAGSNRASEGLARQLLETGVLSAPDTEQLQQHARRKRCPEINALLELQLLPPREVLRALQEQVRLRLVECFGWDRGRFELRPEPAAEAVRGLGISVHALIQEGIESHWSAERVLTDLRERMTLHPTGTRGLAPVAAALRRDPAVDELLQSLDGERSLWQLLQAASTPRALAAAWVLDAAGVLVYSEAPAAKTGARSAPRVEIVVGEARRTPRRERVPRADLPGPEAEAAPLAESEDLARAIDERHARLAELDRYALLGVDRDADASEIKYAYLSAAKLYHPDVIGRAGLDRAVRQRATRLFAEIGKAYAVLSDPERRRQYDLELEGGGETLDAERLATAEGLYRKGEILLRQGNFRGALEFLAPAAELWPEEAAYQAALGWALYKKLPSEPERAREHLERAVGLDPGDSTLTFRLSVVLRSLGEAERSRELLDRARS